MSEFIEIIITEEEQRRRSAEWYGDAYYSDSDAPSEHRRPAKQKTVAEKSRYSVPVEPVVAEIKLLQLQLINQDDKAAWWSIHTKIHCLLGKLRKILRTRLYDKSVTMKDFEAAAPLLSECQYAGLVAFDFKRYITGRCREVWEFSTLRDAVLSLIERKHPSNYPNSIAHRKIVEVRGNVREPGCAYVKILDREYYPPLTNREYLELRDDGCDAMIAIANTTQFLIACTSQGANNAYHHTQEK